LWDSRSSHEGLATLRSLACRSAFKVTAGQLVPHDGTCAD
jgi:hypothetical protein